MASIRAMLWPTAASISCRTTPRWSFRTIRLQAMRAGATPAAANRKTINRKAANRVGATRREPVSSVYFAASGDLVADGRDSLGRPGRLHAVAGLRAAGSGLSHHSGAHFLSRREPDGDGHDRDGAARASIR